MTPLPVPPGVFDCDTCGRPAVRGDHDLARYGCIHHPVRAELRRCPAWTAGLHAGCGLAEGHPGPHTVAEEIGGRRALFRWRAPRRSSAR